MGEMGKGLVYVWATATAGMFLLYVIFSFVTPAVGYVDAVIYRLFSTLDVPQSWLDMYNQWVPYLRDFMGYLAIASFASLIIYLIVNSARREPNEIPY